MLEKGYTDFASGFNGAEAIATKPIRKDGFYVCDFEKVIDIIEQNKDKTISLGLLQDWSHTSAPVFENGKYVKNYIHVASNWATPALEIEETGELIDCSMFVSLDEANNHSSRLPSNWLDNNKNEEE